jgi:CRISPR-associated endonuclease/helicase Cas3
MAAYSNFFLKATDRDPYPYQVRLASLPFANRAWRIPTGAGKTASAVLSWFYRLEQKFPDAPRRMAYCLPMRTLVEQTREQAARWRDKLGLDVQIATLMGGELDESWEIRPEKPALIIGTQDMLLSRALNRGYGMSRYRWPVHFGLLNNDVVWVCDEVQLMGDGLSTTTQLAAFREQIGSIGNCPTIWMSATLDATMLRSVDLQGAVQTFELCEEDYTAGGPLYRRLHAAKRIQKAPAGCRRPAGLAQFLLDCHKPGTQTIAVVNRVARARETFDAVRKIAPDVPCYLLHSRFRPWEKREWRKIFEEPTPPAGRVLIATQVIEAGVDISSTLMVTDLAPWSSLVQRFGRCNRGGEIAEGAEIYWVDRPLLTKSRFEDSDALTEDISRPYDVSELTEAEERLAGLESGAPATLPNYPMRSRPVHVLRRRDLVDFFDTTADLSGYDLDVSRFIRSEQDRDVLIAWRDKYPPSSKIEGPSRDELCPAPIGELSTLLKASKKGKQRLLLSTWNALDGCWQELNDAEILRPGMSLIADAKSGCYDVNRGWDVESVHRVPQVPGEHSEQESFDDDFLTFPKYAQTLEAHSREVRDLMGELLAGLAASLALEPYREDLLIVALHHDWGKSHPVFQATVNPDGDSRLMAKSKTRRSHGRKHFRHELASALAIIQSGGSDLAGYLVAAHHGKVRLSIRALPGEEKPKDEGVRFARGIHDGDELLEAKLDGVVKRPLSLDMEPMLLGLSESGAKSWMDRMLGLRDQLGVFRLAYLEALIVAADCRASASPKDVLP